MPKKKVNPAEEPEQTTGLMEQAGEEALAPMGEPPQDMGTRDDALHPELGETGDVPPNPGDAPNLSGEGEGEPPEVLAVDVSAPPAPPDDGPEDCPPMEPPDTAPGDGQSMDAQEPGPAAEVSMEDVPSAGDAPPGVVGDALPPRKSPRQVRIRPPRRP